MRNLQCGQDDRFQIATADLQGLFPSDRLRARQAHPAGPDAFRAKWRILRVTFNVECEKSNPQIFGVRRKGLQRELG